MSDSFLVKPVIYFPVTDNRKFGNGMWFMTGLNIVPQLISCLFVCLFIQCGGNSSSQDCKALQRVVRLAERISGSALPSLQDIYLKRCKSRAVQIIKDLKHPSNCLFTLLPSGKRFRCLMAKTERPSGPIGPIGPIAAECRLTRLCYGSGSPKVSQLWPSNGLLIWLGFGCADLARFALRHGTFSHIRPDYGP